MGSSGEMIVEGNLPSLKHLKLNFWHARLWLRTAMELAMRSWRLSDRGGPRFVLKLELFKTVDNFGYINPLDDHIVDEELVIARNQARIYDLKLPTTLDTITLSASAGTEAAYALATYKHDTTRWRFNKDGDKDTKAVKYLVW